MKKFVSITIILLLLFIAGCEEATPAYSSEETTNAVTTTEITTSIADGYDEIGGAWLVNSIYYNNQTIALSSSSSLESLYNHIILTFREDGTFWYANHGFQEGKYVRRSENSFILKPTIRYTLQTVDGEVVKVYSETTPQTSYIVTVTDGGESIRFAAFDPMINQESDELIPLIMTKMQ